MKYVLLVLMLLMECLCQGEESEKILVQLDKQKILAEALACLKKANPELDANNLEFFSIDYRYNATTGPTLSVAFKLLDSKSTVIQDRTTTTSYTTQMVSFPRATLPGVPGSQGSMTESSTVTR